MSIEILESRDGYKAMYCNTTMLAFGVVLAPEDNAEEFLKWLPSDARAYTDGELQKFYNAWRERERVVTGVWYMKNGAEHWYVKVELDSLHEITAITTDNNALRDWDKATDNYPQTGKASVIDYVMNYHEIEKYKIDLLNS